MTGPEDLLRDSLRDRAEHHTLPAPRMGDVEPAARRVRRARRVRTGVVAAAVVAALAVPVALVASGGREGDLQPASPSGTPAPAVRLADLPAGPPPAVPWIDGADYVAGDGTRTTLPFDDVVRAAPYRGGLLVLRRDEGLVVQLDDSADVGSQWCGDGAFAVTADGASTAFVVRERTPRCRGVGDLTLHLGPTSASGTADQTRPVPLRASTPVGVLGDTVVASAYDDGPPVLLDLDGTSTTIDGLSRVSAVESRFGLVAGQLSGSAKQRLTGAVVDPVTGSVAWTAFNWQLAGFSPDGSMVVALRPGALDSPLEWRVFDARTGSRLHAFTTPPDLSFLTLVWEDDEHLLLSGTQSDSQGGTEALVRVALDGTLERATDAARFDGDLFDVRYRLAPITYP